VEIIEESNVFYLKKQINLENKVKKVKNP